MHAKLQFKNVKRGSARYFDLNGLEFKKCVPVFMINSLLFIENINVKP